MSDLKQVLSDEIRRLARKEIKQAVQPLQATIVSLRRQISELKKLYSEANKKAEKTKGNWQPYYNKNRDCLQSFYKIRFIVLLRGLCFI